MLPALAVQKEGIYCKVLLKSFILQSKMSINTSLSVLFFSLHLILYNFDIISLYFQLKSLGKIFTNEMFQKIFVRITIFYEFLNVRNYPTVTWKQNKIK